MPLYARADEFGYDRTLNSNFTISYLLEQNVPPDMILLGENFFSHYLNLIYSNLEPDIVYGQFSFYV